jgi:hypothetical protein
VPWATGTPFLIVTVVVGFLTFVGVIHSFRRLYYRWLAVAESLQGVVITLLFGACYLLVVPWFALVARLIGARSRSRIDSTTYWRSRNASACDENYFARMG